MAEKKWVITDVRQGVWVDYCIINARDIKLPPELNWSVSKQTLHGGLRDGVDLIEVNNGALSFSIIPTRGMGIWKGNFRGISLGWDAPIYGPVNPKFVNLLDLNGLGWLQGFDEMIVRCGLNSNGAPGKDEVIDNMGNPRKIDLTLHGKIANIPAHFVEVVAQSEPPYAISIIGHVQESMLFFPQLELRTTITTWPGSNRFTIVDEIVNRKSMGAELELLYHCNFGNPFLEERSIFSAPIKECAPRDVRAQEGMETLTTFNKPTSGFVEQVYWFSMLSDEQSHVTPVMLHNAVKDKAVVLRYNNQQLPCFSLWKNTQAESDGYVTGLEPGTNFPNAKQFERNKGRVITIEPSKSYKIEVMLEILDSSEQIKTVEKEISSIQSTANPTIYSEPQPKYSPI